MRDRADELVFVCGVSPLDIDKMTLSRLRYWHSRAVKMKAGEAV